MRHILSYRLVRRLSLPLVCARIIKVEDDATELELLLKETLPLLC